MSKKTAGLEGVNAGDSAICLIDGDKQALYYSGYNVADLAEKSTFEETSYLLLNQKLPTELELREFKEELAKLYSLPHEIIELIQTVPSHTNAMDVLRTAASALSFYDGLDSDTYDKKSNIKKTLRLLVQLPLIIATYHRMRKGQELLQSKPELGIAGNFLYLLSGQIPTEQEARFFDICLILHADHGFNASTFTGRVIAGTYSDMHSAIAGAIGALKGPLHGGANKKVKDMLNDIHDIDKVNDYINKTLESGGKIFGFGHRVYRTCEDPRALILRKVAEELSDIKQDRRLIDLSLAIRERMLQLAAEKGKPIFPNVDFFSASVYSLLNIEEDLFTPIFAMSRCAGWCAHVIEQHENNRLIRPSSEYTGERDLEYTDIKSRN